MMTLSRADKITTDDHEVEVFNAIASATKDFEPVLYVDHKCLYMNRHIRLPRPKGSAARLLCILECIHHRIQ